jgi:hypothetical protein
VVLSGELARHATDRLMRAVRCAAHPAVVVPSRTGARRYRRWRPDDPRASWPVPSLRRRRAQRSWAPMGRHREREPQHRVGRNAVRLPTAARRSTNEDISSQAKQFKYLKRRVRLVRCVMPITICNAYTSVHRGIRLRGTKSC